MDDARSAGWMLALGTALGALTMLMHPTGAQLLADLDRIGPRNLVAHGIAIAGVPLSFAGLACFASQLPARRAWVVLGITCYALASVAVVIAAVASGLLAPAIAARLLGADADTRAIWEAIFRFNGQINQGFAAVYVVALASALGCWSYALRRAPDWPRWLAALGFVASLGTLAVLVRTQGHLDVHSFGLIILVQGAWMLGVAVRLIRRPSALSSGRSPSE